MEEPKDGKRHPLIVWAERGKRLVAGVLLVMMFVVLVIAVIELIWVPLAAVVPGLPRAVSGGVLMSEAQMLEAFGVFLSVLIALELMETVEVYFKDHEVHAEIVVLVALIAIARKVVLLDLHDYSPWTIMALAALFIGLGAAYVAVRWMGPRSGRTPDPT